MSRKPPTPLPDTDDPYLLLDVRPGASADQIRRAYLRRVKMFKPDRHPAEFRRVREAYDNLREQEAWFDAWRQAGDVIRQAAAESTDTDANEGHADDVHAEGQSAGSPIDDAQATADATEQVNSDAAAAQVDGNATADAAAQVNGGVPEESTAAEADDDATADSAALESIGDHSDPHTASHVDDGALEPIGDEVQADELLADLEIDPERSAANDLPGGVLAFPHDASEPAHDQTSEAQADDAAPPSLETATAERRRRATREVDNESQLDRLSMNIHAALAEERITEAATLLLGPDAQRLASQPDFTPLLLEVCCVLVWAAPTLFDEVVSRYADLVDAHDAEHRDGALLHRRTLADEFAGWSEAVADWPQLRRFVALGSSLRAPAEAELGLRLGQRAATEPTEFLTTLLEAGRRAPGIVALYVGMAERWAQRYGRGILGGTPPKAPPSVDEAATAIAHEVQTHRSVRWERARPVLTALGIAAVLVLSHSAWLELVVIGAFVVQWAWQAWRGDPAERLYVRVVQPAAASWLWATGVSPDELAVALQARLPKAGTLRAVLFPGNLGDYPDMLCNDLTLLAFGVTAPMIPMLGRRQRAR